MPGFNTLPAVGGGGGQANMTYVASIHMNTYNRSWSQGGTAGYYALYSTNQENGYAYFVGSGTTTGIALNRLANVSHSFTRIDIIAPTNDMISLYKAKVKSTTEFQNPFTSYNGGIPSFAAPLTSSGNFVLPNNALPLVNVMVVGPGAGGGRHGGGGGGGGNIVKLTAYQAVGTTGVTIAGATGYQDTSAPGSTYFGNVFARGGSYGASHGQQGGQNAGNGGGGGGHSGDHNGGVPAVQGSTTGLGNTGSPILLGSNKGYRSSGENGGGGAGAGGGSTDGSQYSRTGGPGHASDITGTNTHYSAAGGGGYHGQPPGAYGGTGWSRGFYGMGGHGGSGDTGDYNPNSTNRAGSEGGPGIVVVRYYIP
jgi:hypothetical protein